MAYTAPNVSYSSSIGGTYSTLTGVQSVVINRGRQKFSDNFSASTCTIELIPANTYSTPIAIGQFIDVRTSNSASSNAYFTGKIIDVERTYDVPYNSSTGAAPGDRITITATGGTGVLAANTVTDYVLGATSTNVATNITELANFVGLDGNLTGGNNGSVLKPQPAGVSGGAFDIMNQMMRTGQYRIDDLDMRRVSGPGIPTVGVRFWAYASGTNIHFNDGALDIYTMRYKSLNYLSSNQTTYNQANVTADTLDTQVANYGNAPYNTLNYSSYNASTTDAYSLAGYLVNILSGQLQPAPFSISTDTTVSDTCMEIGFVPRSDTAYSGLIGNPVKITFRGSVVYGVLEGFGLTFYPDKASIVCYFSPSLGQAFILDSPTFGVLDTNRLGYP